MKQIGFCVLGVLMAVPAMANDFLTFTSKWIASNPQMVMSTAQALTKLTEMHVEYKCISAQKDNNAIKCREIEAQKSLLGEVTLEQISQAENDLADLAATDTHTAQTKSVLGAAREAKQSPVQYMSDPDGAMYLLGVLNQYRN